MTDPVERPSSLQPLGDGVAEVHADDLDRIDGIDLRTLNTTAAVAFGLRVGLDAITQVLRNSSGPLGPKRWTEGQ